MQAYLILRCSINRTITLPIIQKRFFQTSFQSGVNKRSILWKNPFSSLQTPFKNPCLVLRRNEVTVPNYQPMNSLPDLAGKFRSLIL